MMFFLKRVLGVLSISLYLVSAQSDGVRCVTHNGSFVPDVILRVTAQNVSQSCLPAKPTVLVNGTSPGPEITLLEGETTWIRVYNDMTLQNLTMVSECLVRWSNSFGMFLESNNTLLPVTRNILLILYILWILQLAYYLSIGMDSL